MVAFKNLHIFPPNADQLAAKSEGRQDTTLYHESYVSLRASPAVC